MRGSVHPPTVPLGVCAAPSTQARDRAGQAPSPVYPRRGAPRPRDPNTAPTPIDSRTRDKPPPLQPPLPFARKGRGAQERGVRDRYVPRLCSPTPSFTREQDTRHGTAWDKARAPPLSPLAGDRARNARGSVVPPPPGSRAGPPTNEGSARGDENRRAPTPLPHPPLHARAVRERGRTLQVGVHPPLPGFARTGNVQTGTHRSGAPSTTQVSEPGGVLEPDVNGRTHGSTPPPFPRVACQGETRMGDRAEAPPLSRRFARQGNTRTGSRMEASPSPAGSRARATREQAAARKPPPLPRVCAPGQNANGRPRRSPPPSPAGSRQGKTRTGGRADAPPLPRVRAPGQNANG
ncbi:hypothetical protein EDB89DRAFT_1902808 [Lactarius sanguifluus]|nr:hypothetical protein EDB89DRAFT_1902808 [Lactarius sanguifluus]